MMSNFIPPEPKEPGSEQEYRCMKCGETFTGKVPERGKGFKKGYNVCPKCGGAGISQPIVRW